MMGRVGIFGGSFDPVHLGHLWIASAAAETLSLDVVRWIPAAVSPLKPHGPVASNDDRLSMVRLAIGGDPRFAVDDRELRREGVSYTADTVREIASDEPDAELFLIVGGDSVATFDRWREPESILETATLAAVRRGGEGQVPYPVLAPFCDAEGMKKIVASEIAMPAIELSSGELRQRISDGRSVRYRVPAAVEAFIAAEKIYR